MLKVRIERRTRRKITRTALTGPTRVKVGFPAGEADGLTISKAVWNEFGTRGGASGGGWGGPIPERPFMRNAIREGRGTYRSLMKADAKGILEGTGSLDRTMRRLGELAKGDIQANIGSTGPANSPVTVELKGSSTPLIDTAAMRQAVTYKVEP
jgi:hypothetical protein